jgi:uncharacterized protein
MWTSIARFILRYRVALLIFLSISTIFMAYNARKVGLSYEYASLLPQTDSANINYKNFQKQFGHDANVLIIGVKDNDFFQLEKFNDFIALCDSIKTIYGVKEIVSVAHSIFLEKNTNKKRFDITKPFSEPIASQEELDLRVEKLLSTPFYKGYLYNDELNLFILAITIEQKILDSPEREGLIKQITDITHHFEVKYESVFHFSGLPYIRTITSLKLRNELTMFIVFAGLICALILFAFFRSLKVVSFCMLVVGVSVTWVMGWMGIFDFKISILTSLIPPLIIVIGVPNCVFLLNKYHSEFKLHGNKIKALQRVIRKIGNATFLTNLTTASGFATFIVTKSNLLNEFGLIAFLGIMGVFVFSLLLIPTMFSFLSPPTDKQLKHLDAKFINKVVDFFIRITVKRRTVLYIYAIIIFGLGIIGVSKIKSTGYIVDDLPHHDPILVDLKILEKNFNGVMPLEIVINTNQPNGALKANTLKMVDNLQNKLEAYEELSTPMSIINILKFARQSYYNGNSRYYALPNSFDRNFIINYIAKEKSELQYALLDSNRSTLRISCNVKDIGTVRMKALEQDIHNEISSVFEGTDFKITTTGSSIVFFKGTNYLIKNLFLSLSLAVLLIALFMAWMFRSIKMVIVSLIPNLFPLLLTAALMGYLGIPIKPSTILVFSIAFGISVDDTIHFLAKYRQELTHTNWNIGLSVITALKETGVSMIYTSIVLFFGFGIFVASQFGGTVALGALVSTTLLIAMLSNLILLPSLLLTLEKMITNKTFKEPMLQIYDEEEDIDVENMKIENQNE